MLQTQISTFIINLKNRADRKEHILKEFACRDEFLTTIVEPLSDKIGAVSLWNTIRHIIKNLSNENDEYVLICEDDHQFTRFYNKELLFNCLNEATNRKADILSGGVHWFDSGVQILEHLFWADKFTGTQFIIVFRRFFTRVLNANFGRYDAADHKICDISNRIFFIGPFISVQKDFGYSDATPKNNLEGITMEKLFAKSSVSVQTLKDVATFFKNRPIKQPQEESFENISISTYVINLFKSYKHIENELNKKSEFNTTLMEVCENENMHVSLWLTMRKIIGLAVANDDDIVIICEDNIQFTENYSKEFLIQNIIDAHEQGAEIVLGSVRSLGLAVPITETRAWLNHFYHAKFIILYNSIFQKILDEPFDDSMKFDVVLSDITSNKMILFPFIIKQDISEPVDFKEFHNDNNELITSWLEGANTKLQKIYESAKIYKTFS